MKLVTYAVETQVKIGAMTRDCEWVFPLTPLGMDYKNMQELIKDISDSELQLIDYTSLQDPYGIKGAARISEVKLMAPIINPQQDIICLGLNYPEHAEESRRFHAGKSSLNVTGKAVYFAKRISQLSGQNDAIPSHSDIVTSLDYECELAVIIRRDVNCVSPSEVKNYLFGYTIINDVSARNVQNEHGQWFFGKSMDGFAPMGPAILTADSVPYPPELGIRSFVNSEKRQDANTGDMIYSIDDVVSELSRGMILRSGTIIAMGTPSGVGMGFDPPKYLKPDDTVVCEIDGIGSLSNTVE